MDSLFGSGFSLRRRRMTPPAALIEHLKNFAQRLVADFSHALRREFQALISADDVAFLFEHLLDTF